MMSNKAKEALNFELKFINQKISELKSRITFLVEKHAELTKDLDDMSRHYERTAELLDELEHPEFPRVVLENGITIFRGEMKTELVSEFGSSQPVRFADHTNCFMREENGDELMCACGKKSVILIAGKESFTAMCHSCREKIHG